MKADQRLCVVAKLGAARSGEQVDKLPFFDCADLRPCLFQLVEQPGCVSIYHICAQQSFYRKGRDGRKAKLVFGI
jgi:hypothetical protein